MFKWNTCGYWTKNRHDDNNYWLFLLFFFLLLLSVELDGTIEAYDRRDKPSVLVTSPSSPDRVASGASAASGRYQSRLTPSGPVSAESNIGGRIQIKLGFEPGTLQLILTIICATGLTYRANGATRNPYVKVRIPNWNCILQSMHDPVGGLDVRLFVTKPNQLQIFSLFSSIHLVAE